jgi:hypothetical protein
MITEQGMVVLCSTAGNFVSGEHDINNVQLTLLMGREDGTADNRIGSQLVAGLKPHRTLASLLF